MQKKKLTDFEENLFLHAHIKELNNLNDELRAFIKRQSLEIGYLTSEREEWKEKYMDVVCFLDNVNDKKIKLKPIEKRIMDVNWFRRKLHHQREHIKSLENKLNKLRHGEGNI